MVTAVLLTKNEQSVIWRCLESLETVCDRYVFVDTGSTDHTIDLLEAWLVNHAGEIHRRDWVNFAHNRTEALALADDGKSRRLMLDADMTVEGNLDDLPRADAYMLEIVDQTDFAYRLALLVGPGIDWGYEGVTHEYLTAEQPFFRGNVDSLTVHHHCDGSRRPEKLYEDLVLLTAELARNPADARTVFYLAQTHRDLGNVQEAINLYRLRAEMGGWDEEAWYARYQLGCLLTAHVDFYRGADELLRASRERTERIEPLRALAYAASAIADRAEPPADLLFVHRDLYAG